jgi:uncharacterized membrane protein
MPLHPFVVHLPIALALLLPLLAASALVAWWRDWLPGRRAWTPVVVLQALLLASLFAAARTGEAEEERVEAFVGESSLEQHEEAAERLLVAAGAVSLLTAVPLVLRGGARARAAALLAALCMLAVTTLAVQTGKAGGELVYREGAAAAYAHKGNATGPPPGEAAGREPSDDE